MIFGKKKTVAEKNEDSRQLIKDNIAALDRLLIVYDGTEFAKKISSLKGDYKYVSPSETAKAVDKKIGNLLADIELLAKKTEKTSDFTEAEAVVKKIKLELIERK